MKNSEGYRDSTASAAISNVIREQKTQVMRYDLQKKQVHCPACNRRLTKLIRFNIRFCPWCGQKLN